MLRSGIVVGRPMAENACLPRDVVIHGIVRTMVSQANGHDDDATHPIVGLNG